MFTNIFLQNHLFFHPVSSLSLFILSRSLSSSLFSSLLSSSSLIFHLLTLFSCLFSSFIFSLLVSRSSLLQSFIFSAFSLSSFSVSLCPCLRVLWWLLLSLVCMFLWSWCVRAVWCGGTLKTSVFQNVPVCTGTTPASGNTCGGDASTHGDVSNVHTGSVLNVHMVRGVGWRGWRWRSA